MILNLSLRGTLYRYFVCSCEWWVEHATVCVGRSENNLQVWVLSFYLVGPEIELEFSGLAASTLTTLAHCTGPCT